MDTDRTLDALQDAAECALARYVRGDPLDAIDRDAIDRMRACSARFAARYERARNARAR